MKSWRSLLVLLFLLTGIVGCDHTSKAWAERQLEQREAVGVLPGLLDLRLVKNTDTAFSLLGDLLDEPARLAVILVLQGMITVGMAAVLLRRWRDAGQVERVAAALVLGGALGNFSERLVRGYVVDFIHLARWPAFNVADIAICAGTALLLLAASRARSRAPG
jgi:signal peptidase II